ncbi:MAG TPA: hypothetical protein DEP85_00605 [Holosporales bacterium]|nr:hypothetical protein [Holosporales bacterium]
MLMGGLPDGRFHNVFIRQLLHHLVAIFGAPFKMPEIGAALVAVVADGYLHILVLRRTRAHAILDWDNAWRSFGRQETGGEAATKTFLEYSP